ncbi:MAG: glycosyltransferase family 4 protein [Chloroflexi bacterium]|nr:glycosyltransferase family 4 protein [Chloroflexota bacterium]
MIERGYKTVSSPLTADCSAVLVIGGTSRLDILWRARQRGVRIVQRLNGMNWMHHKTRVGWKYALRCEYNNRLLAYIRRSLADRIVYQSEFAKSWWQTVYKTTQSPSQIIYNGVDLEQYSPIGAGSPPDDHIRLLLVEAHVGGGYERGLENAIHLTRALALSGYDNVELAVVGDVPETLKTRWNNNGGTSINWMGVLPRDRIPEIDRSAHLLFSSDLNAACPNSVIEALACGLPVTGYATGSLPELVQGDAGRVAPYGSNYWNLEPPVVDGLVQAVQEILGDLPHFREAARRKAEENFSADKMVDAYLRELTGED